MTNAVLLLLCMLAPFGQDVTEAEVSPSDGKITLNIAVVVIDIFQIDEVDQTTMIDFALVVRWHDPKLADPEAKSIRLLPLTSILNPRLVIVNGRDLTQKLEKIVEVDRKGNILYRQRYQGTLNSPLDLRELPLDVQKIEIEVTTFDPEIVLEPQRDFSGRLRNFTVAGWDIDPIRLEENKRTTRDGQRSLDSIRATLVAHRSIRYFIWNLFVPLGLIVLMAYTVFWLDPMILSTQIALATGSVFALIFYNFSLGQMVPRITYLTRADLYALGCMLLVFIALYEAVFTGVLARKERTLALARRIDLVARFLYPLGYLAVVLITLL